MTNICDKSLVVKGLTSYRCKGRYGWIMIGAVDDDNAFREALRSCEVAKREDLEVWDGRQYVAVPMDAKQGKGK